MAAKSFGIGIVGAGAIAPLHAQAITNLEGAHVAAIFGRRLEAAEDLSRKCGVAAYSDFDAFLAHPGLDIVSICTPSGAHLDYAVAAARAGKHVICEKPLEVTAERADAMITACRDAGVMLCGIFQRRFIAAVQEMKAALDQGRFGSLALASASIKWWRTQAYYDSGAWRGTWALDGGGALMNQGIHTLDLLLHLVGDVKAVTATAACVAHERIEVEDAVVALLEFENGARGVVEASTACYSTGEMPARIEICGAGGSAVLEDDALSVWRFTEEVARDDDIRARYAPSSGPAAGAADPMAIDSAWHEANFADMVEALRTGRAPLISGTEARRAVAVVRAIYASAAQEGRRVTL